jgi:hypothetical protein
VLAVAFDNDDFPCKGSYTVVLASGVVIEVQVTWRKKADYVVCGKGENEDVAVRLANGEISGSVHPLSVVGQQLTFTRFKKR